MNKERKHSIDKLFLESLEGQHIEPSPGFWESLSTRLPVREGRSTILYLVSAILIGAFTFFMHSSLLTGPDGAIAENKLSEDEAVISPQETQAENIQAFDNSIIESDIESDTESDTEPELKETITHSSSPEFTPEQTKASPAGTTPVILTIHEKPGAYRQNDESQGDRLLLMIPMALVVNGQVEANSTMGIRELPQRPYPDPIFDLNIRDSYAKKADVLFGAAFSPAVNIYPDAQNRNDYSLEFVAAYEKSRFLVETGIGGNYTSESAEYRINSTTYDSVGFYVGVTSFSMHPDYPDSVIFQTRLKNLYDSIDRYSVLENTNKYAYLQIPLRIGYRVIQMPRFSLDLKAGLLFSVQIYKDIPGVPYQGNDVDIEVVRQYPDRLTTTWQYTAGIGMNYHINNKMRFTLEPFYRQYIKSAYSPGSAFPARSPYAFGLRGGLYFHF